jgi:hypothetical protein
MNLPRGRRIVFAFTPLAWRWYMGALFGTVLIFVGPLRVSIFTRRMTWKN